MKTVLLLALTLPLSYPSLAHHGLAVPEAEASLLIEMSLSELLQNTNLVVAGTPQEGYSVWESRDDSGGTRIVTYTRVHVDTVLDGKMPAGGDVWVRTLGGNVGHVGQHVDAEAEMVPFESSVLFLHALDDGTHAVSGMSQGQFLLAKASGGASRLQPKVSVEALITNAGTSGLSAHRILLDKTLNEATALIGQERKRAH